MELLRQENNVKTFNVDENSISFVLITAIQSIMKDVYIVRLVFYTTQFVCYVIDSQIKLAYTEQN